MRHYLMFNKKNIADFDAYIYGQNVLNAPASPYESYEVPGRNGNVFIKRNYFPNVMVEYYCIIIHDAVKNLTNLKTFLLSQKGYCRLEDTYNPDEVYQAVFTGEFNVEYTDDMKMVKCALQFERKPQRFVKESYDVGQVANLIDPEDATSKKKVILYNPFYIASNPIIHLSGFGSILVNEEKIDFMIPGNWIVDSENKSVSYNVSGVNPEAYIRFNAGHFPILNPGENTVETVGGSSTVDELKVFPMWWRL